GRAGEIRAATLPVEDLFSHRIAQVREDLFLLAELRPQRLELRALLGEFLLQALEPVHRRLRGRSTERGQACAQSQRDGGRAFHRTPVTLPRLSRRPSWKPASRKAAREFTWTLSVVNATSCWLLSVFWITVEAGPSAMVLNVFSGP